MKHLPSPRKPRKTRRASRAIAGPPLKDARETRLHRNAFFVSPSPKFPHPNDTQRQAAHLPCPSPKRQQDNGARSSPLPAGGGTHRFLRGPRPSALWISCVCQDADTITIASPVAIPLPSRRFIIPRARWAFGPSCVREHLLISAAYPSFGRNIARSRCT